VSRTAAIWEHPALWTQTNLTDHLKVLREAGIVVTEPCGRYTYYRLRREVLAGLSEQFAAGAVTTAR
jgi:DNA-binding transcriptional ArsR family regulator